MSEKVLFVDDDANLLASLERNYRRQFGVETAAGGEAGLAKLAGDGPFAVVVSDRQMPGMDGVQFLSQVCKESPDTIRILLTGNVDLEQAVHAVNEGNIFRFLIKPAPPEILSKTIQDAITQYRLVTAEKQLLNKTLSGSIKLLTDILSMMEPQSFGRAQTMRNVITGVAKKFQVGNEWEIHLAAMLSPIGYVTIPAETLAKSRNGGGLSEVEKELLMNAPETAARLLANIPRLEGVARIARYQDKHYDGEGFPKNGCRGDEIPFGARLLKIINDMHQLQAGGVLRANAFAAMQERRGWYDPSLLETVRDFYGIATAPRDNQRAVIPIALPDLTPGMVLRSDIVANNDMLILKAGHLISEMTLEKIRNFDRLWGIKQPILVETPEPAQAVMAEF